MEMYRTEQISRWLPIFTASSCNEFILCPADVDLQVLHWVPDSVNDSRAGEFRLDWCQSREDGEEWSAELAVGDFASGV